MTDIHLHSNICLREVIEWRFEKEPDFTVEKNAGFEPGVQGIALSVLRTLAQLSVRIKLVCEFPEPETTEDVSASFFNTPFGFSLARLSSAIVFGRERKDASAGFKSLLGATYIQSGGGSGNGKQQALVCVDPRFPVPARLQPNRDDKSQIFPAPSIFVREIRHMVKSMGFTQILSSSAEEPILTLAYELFKNTFEHGIPTTGKSGRSTRAIILEKIVLQNTDISKRQISDELKNYLLRVEESDSSPLKLGVLCMTVVDQGQGIQATLPPVAHETESERLARAFKENESRKPIGAVARGHGLTRALNAAFSLQGMIQICSAGIYGTQDFSIWEEKYPRLHLSEVQQLPAALEFGTAISIFIPEHANSLDQASLFS